MSELYAIDLADMLKDQITAGQRQRDRREVMSDRDRLATLTTHQLLDELDRMLSGSGSGPNVLGARAVARAMRDRIINKTGE
jgi:hypothetical protein